MGLVLDDAGGHDIRDVGVPSIFQFLSSRSNQSEATPPTNHR
jgi:hypothetical protein